MYFYKHAITVFMLTAVNNSKKSQNIFWTKALTKISFEIDFIFFKAGIVTSCIDCWTVFNNFSICQSSTVLISFAVETGFQKFLNAQWMRWDFCSVLFNTCRKCLCSNMWKKELWWGKLEVVFLLMKCRFQPSPVGTRARGHLVFPSAILQFQRPTARNSHSCWKESRRVGVF